MYSVHDNPEGLGFPIRKSTGQRLFAPHRSLSQRTTSFIASCRQGIHRMPLRHLITLIIDAHPRKGGWSSTRSNRFLDLIRQTVRSATVDSCPWFKTRGGHGQIDLLFTMSKSVQSRTLAVAKLFASTDDYFPQGRDHQHGSWWSQTGSNRRPPACKAGALPTELWPLTRDCLQKEKTGGWWAWVDSNYRPHPYQGCALTN